MSTTSDAKSQRGGNLSFATNRETLIVRARPLVASIRLDTNK